MVHSRMTTPVNRYYLRSCDQPSSGETTPDYQQEESSGDSSINLSDLEFEVEDNYIDFNSTMASGIHIAMPPFHGNSGENAKDWVAWFNNFADAHNFNENKKRQTMPFYLKDHALAWYNAQPPEIKGDLALLTTGLETRFNGSDGLDSDMALLSLSQLPNESCNNFFTRILKVTTNKDYPESLITGIALKGLHGNLKQIVMPQNHKTLEDLRKAAILAEKTVLSTSANAASASVSEDDITKRVLDAVTDKLSKVLALGVDRRVDPDPQPPQTWSRQRQDARSRRTPQRTQKPCRRCGGKIFHSFKECAAYGVTCLICKGPNHFSERCDHRDRRYDSQSQ